MISRQTAFGITISWNNSGNTKSNLLLHSRMSGEALRTIFPTNMTQFLGKKVRSILD